MPGCGAPEYSKATWLPSGEMAGVYCWPGIETKGRISPAVEDCSRSFKNIRNSATAATTTSARAPTISQSFFPTALARCSFTGEGIVGSCDGVMTRAGG